MQEHLLVFQPVLLLRFWSGSSHQYPRLLNQGMLMEDHSLVAEHHCFYIVARDRRLGLPSISLLVRYYVLSHSNVLWSLWLARYSQHRLWTDSPENDHPLRRNTIQGPNTRLSLLEYLLDRYYVPYILQVPPHPNVTLWRFQSSERGLAS